MNKMMTTALMSLVFVGMCAGAEEAAEAVAQVTVAAETITEAAAPAAPSTADYAMFAVNDEFVETTIEGICEGARTGHIGDGKIFVLPMDECIRIRTGERGKEAIG